MTTWDHLRGTWVAAHDVPVPKRPHPDRPCVLRRAGDYALAIPALRQGLWFYTTVSRQDDWACGFNWFVTKSGYVQCNHASKTEYLHRLVLSLVMYDDRFMGFEPTSSVDHRNRHRLDNCRRNLRLATQSDQNANQGRSFEKDVGVVWDSGRNRWMARVEHLGRELFVGRFRNKNVAIAARRRYIENLQKLPIVAEVVA